MHEHCDHDGPHEHDCCDHEHEAADDGEHGSPFSVSFVDQLRGHDDDGSAIVRKEIVTFAEASAIALQLTEKAIAEAGSFEKWLGAGSVALVYDASGLMVWDGLVEAIKKYGQQS